MHKKNIRTHVMPEKDRVVPLLRLTDMIPEDAQVVCIGSSPLNLLHSMWLRLQLPDLAEKGFTFASDAGVSSEQSVTNFLNKSGYWPNHPHFGFALNYADHMDAEPYDFKSSSLAETDGHILENMCSTYCASSHYKMQRTAVKLGMCNAFASECVTDGEMPSYAQHVEDVADRLAQMVHTKQKPVYSGGWAFMFTAPKTNEAETSIEQCLYEKGIKVHTLALANNVQSLSLTTDMGRMMYENGGNIIQKIESDLLMKEMNEEHSTYLNMHQYAPDIAGITMPDAVLAFAHIGSKMQEFLYNRTGYPFRPDIEDQIISQLWETGARSAHKHFKELRRQDVLKLFD